MTIHIDKNSTLQECIKAAYSILPPQTPKDLLHELLEQFRAMTRNADVPIEFREGSADGPVLVRVYGPAGREAGMQALKEAQEAGEWKTSGVRCPR